MNLNFSEQMTIGPASAKPTNDDGEEGGDNILTFVLWLKVDDVKTKQHLEELYRLAFGRMELEPIEGETVAHFDYRSIEVGQQLDDHRVKILGYELTAKPVVKKLVQVKGERAVKIAIVIRAEMTEKITELAGKLLANMGDLTRVDFFEVQPKLPLGEKPGSTVVNGRGRFGNNKPQAVGTDASGSAS